MNNFNLLYFHALINKRLIRLKVEKFMLMYRLNTPNKRINRFTVCRYQFSSDHGSQAALSTVRSLMGDRLGYTIFLYIVE